MMTQKLEGGADVMDMLPALEGATAYYALAMFQGRQVLAMFDQGKWRLMQEAEMAQIMNQRQQPQQQQQGFNNPFGSNFNPYNRGY